MSEWVSIEDGLPESGQGENNRCLTLWSDGDIEVFPIGDVSGWLQSLSDAVITHWMPLPSPPEDKS